MVQHVPHAVDGLLERCRLGGCMSGGARPQFELPMSIMQFIGDEFDAAHCDAAREDSVERATGCAPELDVERARGEPNAPPHGGVVAVSHAQHQATGGVATLAQSTAEALAHGAQQSVEDVAVVGVGRQHVGRSTFDLRLGGQHGSIIDPAGVLVQGATDATERDAERLLPQRGDLANPLEVIVVEPFADAVGRIGKQRDRLGCQEARLVSSGYRPDLGAGLALDDRGGALAHQLVDGDADGDGQSDPLLDLVFESVGDVDW